MFDLQTILTLKWFLLAGPLIGGMCALLSVYVVLRRMALISEGVAHAGFGGVAVAILLGYYIPPIRLSFYIPPLRLVIVQLFGSTYHLIVDLTHPAWQAAITGIFCLLTSLLIGYVSRRKRVSEDSAIGIFLTATVAFGAILIKFRALLPSGYTPEGTVRAAPPPSLESLLFGQFSQVTGDDVLTLAIAAVVIVGILGALYHQFLYTTLDEEMARINGVNTRLINLLLLIMISLVVSICVRMVGFLMITALMIIPGATANLISRRFAGVLLVSLLIGTLGTSAATWAALIPPIDKFPPGPLVVAVLFAIFAVVWAFRHFIKPRVVVPEAFTDTPPEKEPGAFGHGHSH